jgi:hypothetical protein
MDRCISYRYVFLTPFIISDILPKLTVSFYILLKNRAALTEKMSGFGSGLYSNRVINDPCFSRTER